MSIRNAGRQSPILLAGVLLFGAWVALTVFRVYDVMESIWAIGSFEKEFRGVEFVGEAIGQTAFSGIVGLLVMLGVLGLLIALYGALSESEPLPDRFPPERNESFRRTDETRRFETTDETRH